MLEGEKQQMTKLVPKFLAESGARYTYYARPPPSKGRAVDLTQYP